MSDFEDMLRRPRWMEDANCRGLNPDLFFPERGDPTDHIREVCRRCDVQVECLTYALNTGETKGIWGGMSGKERRNIAAGIPPRAAVCGTCAGYNRHLRRGEPTCQACRAAQAQRGRLRAMRLRSEGGAA